MMQRLSLFILVLFLIACSSNDNRIEDAINAKLMAANSNNVRATVKDGVATLTGTCPDESCKHASEVAASETSGVERVVNEVVVKQAGPEDLKHK